MYIHIYQQKIHEIRYPHISQHDLLISEFQGLELPASGVRAPQRGRSYDEIMGYTWKISWKISWDSYPGVLKILKWGVCCNSLGRKLRFTIGFQGYPSIPPVGCPKDFTKTIRTVNRSSQKLQNPLNIRTLRLPLRSAEMFRSVLRN